MVMTNGRMIYFARNDAGTGKIWHFSLAEGGKWIELVDFTRTLNGESIVWYGYRL